MCHVQIKQDFSPQTFGFWEGDFWSETFMVSISIKGKDKTIETRMFPKFGTSQDSTKCQEKPLNSNFIENGESVVCSVF
jgi:hypothetical protein